MCVRDPCPQHYPYPSGPQAFCQAQSRTDTEKVIFFVYVGTGDWGGVHPSTQQAPLSSFPALSVPQVRNMEWPGPDGSVLKRKEQSPSNLSSH